MENIIGKVYFTAHDSYFFVENYQDEEFDWEYFQVDADTLKIVDKMHEEALTEMVKQEYLTNGGGIIGETNLQNYFTSQQ